MLVYVHRGHTRPRASPESLHPRGRRSSPPVQLPAAVGQLLEASAVEVAAAHRVVAALALLRLPLAHLHDARVAEEPGAAAPATAQEMSGSDR